jgi:hypothetical protein
MQSTKFKKSVIAGSAIAISVGIVASPMANAASVIDLPDSSGNTFQVAAGGDKIAPQFSLWPLPSIGNGNVKTVGNEVIDRGNNAQGQAWLFGYGTGNVIQLGTGGNIFAPQVAVGTDNNLVTNAQGNFVANTGNNSKSVTGGQVLGTVLSGNGNVLQVEFFQGNIIAPQVALAGDNKADHTSQGNGAFAVGNDSVMVAKNAGMLAFVDGNGNVVQIQILSNNVIAPQFVADGTNNLVVETDGNAVNGAGNSSKTVLTGMITVSNNKVGNGNVTQISILSNNVIAPQIAVPGPLGRKTQNVSSIDTDTNEATQSGNDADTVIKGSVTQVKHPILDAVTGTDKHPILNKITQPFTNSQIGNGNVNQGANGSGAISNIQVASNTNVRPNPIRNIVNTVQNVFKPKKKASPAAANSAADGPSNAGGSGGNGASGAPGGS